MPKRKNMEGTSRPGFVLPQSIFSMHKNDTTDRIVKSAYLSPDYSDMEIICRDVVFHAHKVIICPQSEYFKTACSSGFKESQEPIRLPDTEPALMKKVLEFFYTGEYTFDFKTANGSSKPHTSSLHHASVGQSGSVPLATPNTGPSEPVPCVQQSSITTSGTNPEGATHQSEVNPNQSQENASSSGTPVTSENPTDTGSYDQFVAYCLTNPAYFHVRMYAEADYFMIDNLKQAAISAFEKDFAIYPRKKTFEETIRELYSIRADYQPLREVAIQMLVGYMHSTPKRVPFIYFDFMDSNPDFTLDLCMALVPIGVRPLANTRKAPTTSPT